MKAQFRMYPDGEIIALFPEEPVTEGGMCLAFVGVGFLAVDPKKVLENTEPAPKGKYARRLRQIKQHRRLKRSKRPVDAAEDMKLGGLPKLETKGGKERLEENRRMFL